MFPKTAPVFVGCGSCEQSLQKERQSDGSGADPICRSRATYFLLAELDGELFAQAMNSGASLSDCRLSLGIFRGSAPYE